MCNWEYVRVMNRNYLQIKNVSEYEASFECKMLLSESIEGLLPCKEREINGVSYLLYDISSMQSLASIYSGRKMKISDFANLVYSLRNISGKLRTFLLEAERMVLLPEFIFQDIDTGEIKYIYYPGEFENKNNTERLYQFLLSVIDHDDEELTNIVYELYEDMSAGAYNKHLETLYIKVEKLQNKELLKPELLQAEFLNGESLKNNKKVTDSSNDYNGSMPEYDFTDVLPTSVRNNLYELERAENKNVSRHRIYRKILLSGVTYILAVGVALYYLYSNYILTSYENIITWGAIALITAVLVAGVFMWLKRHPTKPESIITTNKPEDVVICEDKEEESFFQRDYGKTVYFEPEGVQNKLYGIGKGNRRTIEINKFPYIIGKKADVVDGVIDEPSISRMHARFEEEDGKIYITDLNSTNGTCKNGIMLSPNRKIEVFAEDEIWFGRLRFIYR